MALRHAEAARNMHVPLLGGRNAALDARRAHLGDAVEWAESAMVPLDGATGPFDDARTSVKQLMEVAADIRSARRVGSQLYRLDGPVAHARNAASLLESTADAMRRPADELLPLIRERSAQAHYNQHQARQIRAIGLTRYDDLGPAAPYAASYQPNYASKEMLVAAIGDEPNHWQAFWRLAEGAESNPVSVRSLRDAFEHTASTFGGDVRARMPQWLLAADPAASRILTSVEAESLRLRVRAASRDDVARYLLSHRNDGPIRTRNAIALHEASLLPEPLRLDVTVEGADIATIARGRSVPATLYPALEDTYARIAATTSDTVLANELQRQFAEDRYVQGATERIARIGLVDPAAVLGAEGASAPWALSLLERGLVRQASIEQSNALRSTFAFVERTGGSRAALLDELDTMTKLAPEERSFETLQAGLALRLLPDEARPAEAASIQALLDKAFDGSGKVPTASAPNSNIERANEAIRVMLEAERLAADPTVSRATLAREFDELLAPPVATLDDDAVRRLAVLASPALELTPGAPPSHLVASHVGADRALDLHVDIARIHRAAARLAQEPSTSRASVAAELAELLARPRAELTGADVRRIVVLANVPEELAPWAGVRPFEEWSRDGLRWAAGIGDRAFDPHGLAKVGGRSGLAELDALELGLDRLRAVEAGITPESARDELRTLVATATRELDGEQQRRIAMLDGLPEANHAFGGERLASTAAWSSSMGTNELASFRQGVDTIRMQLAAFDAAIEEGITADSALSEAVRMLVPRDISDEASLRLAMLAAMPKDVRIPLQPNTRSQLVESVVSGWTGPRANIAAEVARAELHSTRPPDVADVIAAMRRDGGSLDVRVLSPNLREVVANATSDELQSAGTSHRALVAEALEATRGSGSRRDVHEATESVLPLVRTIARETGEMSSDRQLVDQLEGLLTRNAERASGARNDGYDRHPDYAEHGRAIELAQLLSRIEGMRLAHPRATFSLGAADDAPWVVPSHAANEVLSW